MSKTLMQFEPVRPGETIAIDGYLRVVLNLSTPEVFEALAFARRVDWITYTEATHSVTEETKKLGIKPHENLIASEAGDKFPRLQLEAFAKLFETRRGTPFAYYSSRYKAGERFGRLLAKMR